MIQEQKHLLLADLCARLPYGVKCKVDGISQPMPLCTIQVEDSNNILLLFDYKINDLPVQVYLSEVKPYLRPISAMTEKECDDLFKILTINEEEGEYIKINDIGILRLFCVTGKDFEDLDKALEYCDKHFIDYRGLISKGLALEASENMYKF